MGTSGTDRLNVCDFWKPTTWSSRDTPETVEGNKINNARRKAWCEK